jgi:hypothetical protein
MSIVLTIIAGTMDGLPLQGWMTYMLSHCQDREKMVKMEGFACGCPEI